MITKEMKMCNALCNNEQVSYIGLSNDGYNDIVAWKNEFEEYGYFVVDYVGDNVVIDKSQTVENLDFDRLMTAIQSRRSQKAEQNINEIRRRIYA